MSIENIWTSGPMIYDETETVPNFSEKQFLKKRLETWNQGKWCEASHKNRTTPSQVAEANFQAKKHWWRLFKNSMLWEKLHNNMD